MDTTPFLTHGEFEAMFRPLSTREVELVKLAVQVVADWIRHPDRLPNLAASPPGPLVNQAKLVTFSVVSQLLGPAGQTDPRVRSYTSEVNDRSTTITYAEVASMVMFDESHYQLLGLTMAAEPRATFDPFETAFDDVATNAAGYTYRRW